MANQNRYYRTPFAESGNKAEVPNVSVGGAVGYDTGFGPDYELPQGTVNRKRIERNLYNGMHNGITKNLKQWQENLYPTWIEDDGTGVAFAYPEGMIVNHAGDNWISNEAANQEEPGAGSKWAAYLPSKNTLQGLSGLTSPSDLAQRHRIKATVAEVATGVFKDGDRLEVSDRDNWPFNVVAGVADSFGKLDAGGGNIAQIQITSGIASFAAFGAVGDFNPATGIGTDSRSAIQACINHMISLGGGKIEEHTGKFYLGTGYNEPSYAHQVSIGDQDGTVIVKAPNFDTTGAEFYAGAAGKCFVYAMAKDSKWEGFKAFGYTGGTLGASREQDTPLLINKKSDNIEICGNGYITNSLGDAITVSPDVTVAGGGLGSAPTNIKIHHMTLKERFGNGVMSSLGGTKSREALAIIEGVDVSLHDNLIIGSVDLEPNLTGQYIVRCKIDDNIFSAGHVTPQSTIGADYWHDEPTALTGGTEINNDIKLQGVAGAPIIEGNTCNNNTIESGRVLTGRDYEFESVNNNTFKYGVIQLGNDSNFGSTTIGSVQGNTTRFVYPGSTGFIDINGQVSDSLIAGNASQDASLPCVSVGVASVGPAYDQGNVFKDNLSNSANTYVGTFNKSSVVRGAEKILNADYSKQVVFTIAGTGLTIDWAEHGGNSWYIQQAAGAATSIANIINIPGDGFILNIMAEASAGGSLTILNSASIVLKLGSNLTLENTNSVNIIENFGRRIEI